MQDLFLEFVCLESWDTLHVIKVMLDLDLDPVI